jgi:hypothetical protein
LIRGASFEQSLQTWFIARRYGDDGGGDEPALLGSRRVHA